MTTNLRRRARRAANDDLLTWLVSKVNSTEKLEKALGILLKLSLFYGGVWIFQYCYFGISFTPVDLSIGDGVYWLFAAAAIGLMTLLLAVMGLVYLLPWFALLPVSTPKRRRMHVGRHLRPPRRRRRWLRRIRAWSRQSEHRKIAAMVCHVFASALLMGTVYVALRGINPKWMAWAEWKPWSEQEAGWYLGGAAVMQFVAASLLHRVRRRADWVESCGFGALSSLIYFLLLFALEHQHWALLDSILVGGMFLGLLLLALKGVASKQADTAPMAWVMGILVFFAPMIAALWAPAERVNFLSSMVFQQLGLAAYDTNVVVSGDSAKSIKQLIDREQIKVIHCDLDGDSLALSGVDVPWQGLGQKTLLSVRRDAATSEAGGKSRAKFKEVRLALPAGDVTAYSSDEPRCASLPTKVYFQFGSDLPSDGEMLTQLRQDMAELMDMVHEGWCVSKVVATARSDQRPLPGNQNDLLARRRAERVIREAGLLSSGQCEGPDHPVDVELVGSREPVRANCGVRGDAASLAECEAANRMVQVRVMLKRLPSK